MTAPSAAAPAASKTAAATKPSGISTRTKRILRAATLR
jgi:hypothetical protein